MDFSSPEAAAKLRDLIRRMIQSEFFKQRSRLATVNTIDRANRKATVTFTGETSPVTVKMGGVQPYNTGAGNVVRIAGPPGDRYIDAIVQGKVYVDVGP